MKKPMRFWRTGAVAVVLAAIGGAGFADDANAIGEGSVLCISSPYDVDETVNRIAHSARQHGVQVFGCFDGERAAAGKAHRQGDDMRVVVLESAAGGTPVWMAADDALANDAENAFELPLGIRVRPAGDGRAEVWVEAPDVGQVLPQGLEVDLATRDEVVRDALRPRAS